MPVSTKTKRSIIHRRGSTVQLIPRRRCQRTAPDRIVFIVGRRERIENRAIARYSAPIMSLFANYNNLAEYDYLASTSGKAKPRPLFRRCQTKTIRPRLAAISRNLSGAHLPFLSDHIDLVFVRPVQQSVMPRQVGAIRTERSCDFA